MLMNYLMVPLINLFCHSGSSTEKSSDESKLKCTNSEFKGQRLKTAASRITGDTDLRGHVSDDELQRLVTVIEVSG